MQEPHIQPTTNTIFSSFFIKSEDPKEEGTCEEIDTAGIIKGNQEGGNYNNF